MRRIGQRGAFVALVITLTSACGTTVTSPSPPSTTTTRPERSVFAAGCHGTLVATRPGTVISDSITELSGLAASRRVDGVLWAHNDSGDAPRIFAVGFDGRDLGQYTLSGAFAIDWEDIAVGPGPGADPAQSYLYVGDIGDNAGDRGSVQVYRVPEPIVDLAGPTPPPQVLDGVAALNFTYPDGPHDAEALIVDPVSGELFILTKVFGGTVQMFRAPANLPAGSTTALTDVSPVSFGFDAVITAADVSPAGDVVALRTYASVELYARATGTPLADAFAATPCTGTVASEPQGEALTFTRDGLGYVTASEGSHPHLHHFATP